MELHIPSPSLGVTANVNEKVSSSLSTTSSTSSWVSNCALPNTMTEVVSGVNAMVHNCYNVAFLTVSATSATSSPVLVRFVKLSCITNIVIIVSNDSTSLACMISHGVSITCKPLIML